MNATPSDLNHFISAEHRASIRAPISSAGTLPRQAFTSQAFFELEQDAIFSDQWLAICFEEQLPNVGDILPLEFAKIPLLAIRDEKNTLRIFHNIVPYDGCLAVLDPIKSAESISTPYHGWQYNLQGKLISAPYWNGHQAPDLENLTHHACDLKEVSSNVFCGVVFIHFSEKPSEFKEKLLPLMSALESYRIEALAIGRDSNNAPLIDSEGLNTNWKTHYENWALNVLHEGFTHAIYEESEQIPRVNQQAEKTYREHIDGCLMALSYREQDFTETYDLDDVPLSHIGNDPANLPQDAFIGSFFPNLHLAVFPYFIHIIIVLPQSAGKTLTVRAQFYDKDSAFDPAPDTLEEREHIHEEFQEAGEEDARITEAVQKARYSPAFEQQFYSPFWDRMHYTFSNQILDALETHRLGSKETI